MTDNDRCGYLVAWFEEKVGLRDAEIARLRAGIEALPCRETALGMAPCCSSGLSSYLWCPMCNLKASIKEKL